MPTPVNIATVPSHVAGDQFTASMWASLQNNINQGIVEQVGVSVTRNASVSVADSTVTTITFDTDNQDVYGMWLATSPTIITAPVQGWYAWSALATWGAFAGAKALEIHIQKNGVLVQTVQGVTNNDGTHSSFPSGAGHIYLGVGDTVTFQVLQRTGAALSLTQFTGNLVHV